MIRKSFEFTKTASTLIGAFFLLLSVSCKEKDSTADWQQSKETPTQTNDGNEDEKNPPVEPAEKKPATDSAEDPPVRFLSYNLKNYLTMPRYINKRRTNAPKPEEEISALIEIIAASKPDILGICEIGSPEDLKDLQDRLKKEGVDLPHAHHLLGFDSVRTLAILSKFPIIKIGMPENVDYQVGEVPFRMSRGILDATVQLPSKEVRFLGVHLKSKRPIPEADQEMMRRAESGLLRSHINAIIEEKPDTHIIAYGDFNDTKRTPTLRAAMGRLNSKAGLIVLHPEDSRGDFWTHHWSREDIYSRFDYVMVSKGLEPSIDKEGMSILDPENWEQASDHRAIMVPIR